MLQKLNSWAINVLRVLNTKAIQLTPPIEFTLEEALEYIEDDELVEITPQNIRLRKRTLCSVRTKEGAKE